MTAPTFKHGDRVTADRFGRREYGTARRSNDVGSITWVLWDGTNTEKWMHSASLELAPLKLEGDA